MKAAGVAARPKEKQSPRGKSRQGFALLLAVSQPSMLRTLEHSEQKRDGACDEQTHPDRALVLEPALQLSRSCLSAICLGISFSSACTTTRVPLSQADTTQLRQQQGEKTGPLLRCSRAAGHSSRCEARERSHRACDTTKAVVLASVRAKRTNCSLFANAIHEAIAHQGR